jgi:hypothetical protein
MLNINELEQRWLRYKIKSYIPHAVISISLLLIIFIALVLFSKEEIKPLSSNNFIKKTIKSEPKTIHIKAEKKITMQTVVKKHTNTPAPSVNSLNTKMTISPSLDFMKKMQGNTLSNYENPKPSYSKPLKEYQETKKEKVIVVDKAPEPVVKVVPVKIEKKKSAISIKRQNTHDDISQVISRFNKNNNPALSLFIAKKYYELGDYHKAYNYALITNEINNEIEASWIVFSKSLVKLKEKEQAIKTLKKYISQSNSNRANMLLDDIRSGKFK